MHIVAALTRHFVVGNSTVFRFTRWIGSIAVLILFFAAPALAGALTFVPAPVAARNLLVMGTLAVLYMMLYRGRAARLLVVAMASIASLLLVCDAVSYKVTGAPVNYYFWKVVSWPAIKNSFQVFPGLASLAIAVLLLPFMGGLLFLNRPVLRIGASISPWIVAPLGIVAVAAVALSLESSLAHVIKSYARQSKIERLLTDFAALPPRFTFHDDVKAVPGKNIVWVFLESFNDALVDDTQFPGLAPNLSRLTTEGLRLRSLIQIPGQQGSYIGMEAAQCGRYAFHAVPAQYDVCLGHILHAAGYKQVFISGYDEEFYTGLSDRLRSWKFDAIIDKSHFSKMPQYARHKGGWGYFDSALFDYSYLKFIELHRGRKPFHLVLFTQDTHDGDFDTAHCSGLQPPYVGPGQDNKIIQAVHCGDFLLGEFIRQISEYDSNTLIVLVGDHIMHERLMFIRKNYDHVFGLILNGGVRQMHLGPSTHMDVAPTVLALAGIRTNAMFLDGKDLLGSSQPARATELSNLPKEVLDEFGLIRAPDSVSRGIIYKHTASDAFEYIRTNDVRFRERDGIRVYHLETTSYNWRNVLVFLTAKDCARLKGQPYAIVSDQEGESTRFDFDIAQADAYSLEGQCGRLLSFYVSYKFNTKKLRAGIKKPAHKKWEVSLIP